MTRRRVLVAFVDRIARDIANELPQGIGFCVTLYNFTRGEDDHGFSAYASNGRRSDTITHLRALTVRLEAEDDDATLAESIFDAIAHGDDEHRAWLRQALEDHLAGRPVQPPASA